MPIKGYKVVTIPDETHELLQRQSKKTGKSMSEIVCDAVDCICRRKNPTVPEPNPGEKAEAQHQ